ncbi:hypothetical protein ACFX2I_000133 [Malus domestica]
MRLERERNTVSGEEESPTKLYREMGWYKQASKHCVKKGLKISFCIPVGEGCRWLDLDERRCRVHSVWNRRYVPVGLRIWRSGTGRLFPDLQKADLQIKKKTKSRVQPLEKMREKEKGPLHFGLFTNNLVLELILEVEVPIEGLRC